MRSSGRLRRGLVVVGVLAMVVTPAVASADVDPIGHVAAGLGGGTGPRAGFRPGLDVALGGLFVTSSGGQMFGSHDNGVTFDAGLDAGFGKYPTYLFLEGGYGTFGLVAGGFTLGPALRADHHAAPGGEIGASAALFFCRLGIRAIAVPNGGDVQIQATLGLGVP